MPPPWKRNSSHNSPKPPSGGGRGGGGGKPTRASAGGAGRGLAQAAGSGIHRNGKTRVTTMRRDVGIREQPNEYVVVVHAELAVADPMQLVEQAQRADNTPSAVLAAEAEQRRRAAEEAASSSPASAAAIAKAFDPKQVVQLGAVVVHTPSGTLCAKFEALVRPPPTALPLSRYCCDVLGVNAAEVEAALPLVDALSAMDKWVRRVIGGSAVDPDVVFRPRIPGQRVAPAATAAAAVNAADEGSDDAGEDDEEGDDAEESESDDTGAVPTTTTPPPQQDQHQLSPDDDQDDAIASSGPASTHKIILAADGVPTIAAIFHGSQQYMPGLALASDADAAVTAASTAANSNITSNPAKKRFSYLNALSGTTFARWVDVRETFHHFFRVSPKLRLKLHDMLKEIGLSFQGTSRVASDVCANIARLMVACMRKGCVFSYALECRAAHEQDRVVARGDGGGSVTIGGGGGGGGGSGGDAATGGGGASSATARRAIASAAVNNVLANRADMLAALRPVEFSSVPTLGSAGGDSSSSSASVMRNPVFLRWAFLVLLVLGVLYNAYCVAASRRKDVALSS